MDIEDMLREMSRRDRSARGDRSQPLPEAICATLREVYGRYIRDNPFNPGDLVTPCVASDVNGKGEPHIVLEVVSRPQPDFSPPADPSETCSNAYGARRDMRGASVRNSGHSVPSHWVESWHFEPYTGPGSED